MAEVKPGRWTADIEDDFVVFLIGARASRNLLRSFRDLGGRRGMLPMLKRLSEHPEKGLLGYEMSTFGGIIVLRASRALRQRPGRPARRRVAELLEAGRQGRPDRHLARDLPRPCG